MAGRRTVHMDPSQRHDPAYRYMMEPLTVVARRSSTWLPNLPAVARDIKTPVQHLQTFIARRRNARALKGAWGLKGDHDAAALQALVMDYVQLLIMCPRCRKPDTRLVVEERSTVWLDCMGCGARTLVPAAANLIHKEIVRQAMSGPSSKLSNPSDITILDMSDTSCPTDTDFSQGLSADDVARRALEMPGAAQLSSRATRLAMFRQRVEAGASDLRAEAVRCRCEAKAVHVIVQCRVQERCGSLADLLACLSDAAPQLRQFTDGPDGTKAQTRLLYAIEEMLLLHRPALKDHAGHLLARMYFPDHGLDLIGEEAILQWAAQPPPGAALDVRQAAEKFIDWLTHAEQQQD